MENINSLIANYPAGSITEELITSLYRSTISQLSEKERRLVVAALASAYGYGGVSLVHRATDISRVTISKGIKELESISKANDATGFFLDIEASDEQLFLTGSRTRRKGGGRKPAIMKHEMLENIIKEILDDCTYGDPMSKKRWFSCSLRKIKRELENQLIEVSEPIIANIIDELGYSKQINRKMKQVGKPHPDRDRQFKYIQSLLLVFRKSNDPVISVDTKKKEPIGCYLNKGNEYRKKNDPRKVNDHDFVKKHAIPYGIYDVIGNKGFVNIGHDHDTPIFAVNSIRQWWFQCGRRNFPHAQRILILCDGGGSNSSRSVVWKHELWKFATEIGIDIHVSHFPPGSSKWNYIEHRLFSMISINWAGKPLDSIETMKKYIVSVKTETGLSVACTIDDRKYPTGVRLTNKEAAETQITRKICLPLWNYILRPIKML